MDEIIKFTYIMIIFIFLFLIAINIEGNNLDDFRVFVI